MALITKTSPLVICQRPQICGWDVWATERAGFLWFFAGWLWIDLSSSSRKLEIHLLHRPWNQHRPWNRPPTKRWLPESSCYFTKDHPLRWFTLKSAASDCSGRSKLGHQGSHKLWLVVFRPTPLKNGVSNIWDDEIPNMMWKIIHSCSKPPTRTRFFLLFDLSSFGGWKKVPSPGQESAH